MIFPIVISKDQGNSQEFKERLHGYNITFVFDRCKPDIEDECVYYHGAESEGFLAGKMRDYGLRYLTMNQKLLAEDIIMFFDGDRMPLFDVKEIESSIGKYDALLFPCQNDSRLNFSSSNSCAEISDFTEFCKKESSPFWTCGVAIKYSAVKLALNHFGGRLFHSCFDGLKYWEDVALGDYLAHSGFKIGMAPPWMCLSGEIKIDRVASKNLNLEKRNHLRGLLCR